MNKVDTIIEKPDTPDNPPDTPDNPPDMDDFSKIFYSANCELLDNKYEDSLKKYQDLDSKIYNPGLTHNYGLNLFVLKDFSKALEQFMKNIDKMPLYHMSYLGAINAHIYMKNYDKALDLCNKYIGIEKIFIHPQVFLLLNYLYTTMNDKPMANKAYQFANELVKRIDNISETNHLVQCYYESGSKYIYYMF